MNTLKPVEVSDYYIKLVASGMAKYFWENIFKEIFEILQDNKIPNSNDVLEQAIRSGRIWYENGAFRAKRRFSNDVAKALEDLGAVHLRNAYYIERTKLPLDLVKLIDFLKVEAISKATKIEDYLSRLLPILKTLTVNDLIQLTVQKMYKKLELDIIQSAQNKRLPIIELNVIRPKVDVTKKKQKEIESYWREQDKLAEKLRENIKKAPTEKARSQARKKLKEHYIQTNKNAPTIDLSIDELELDRISSNIAKDYVYNMNYWIKKWEVKDVIQMRKDVSEMVRKGVRVPEIAEYFKKRWPRYQNKALFLATNESHLAGSVIKATMYQNLGCTHFRWERSTSIEKRKYHLELAKETNNKYGLNGKNIFSFDNPPIIEEDTGKRGLPKQTYNCHCRMSPVTPSLEEVFKKREEIHNAKKNIFSYIGFRIQNSKQRSNNHWEYRRFG